MIKRLISIILSALFLSGTAYAVQSCKVEEPVEAPDGNGGGTDPEPDPDPDPQPEPVSDFDPVPEGFVEEHKTVLDSYAKVPRSRVHPPGLIQ